MSELEFQEWLNEQLTEELADLDVDLLPLSEIPLANLEPGVRDGS